MPSTYTLISSNTLSTAALSVTFSSIPATYTDLVLRISARTVNTTPSRTTRLRLNGLSTTIYSYTLIDGDGSSATSTRASSTTESPVLVNGNTSTASTFSNTEIYIPNYAGTTQKPISTAYAAENNATAAALGAVASLVNLTSAVTSLEISNSSNFSVGSSFYLYGIKNS
jgi:hypothetical protein